MPEVFRRGDYIALNASEGHAQHVIAFLRRSGDDHVLVAAPRFACTLMRHRPELPLGKVWGHGELIVAECARMRLKNIFTGEELVVPSSGRVPLAQLFGSFPVAILRS
jgi:maltooligosyltrehalose synthase